MKRSITRNSEWAPYLVEPIVTPPGWTVQYSTSMNPCRPEVGPTPATRPMASRLRGSELVDGQSMFRDVVPLDSAPFVGVIPIGAPEIQFNWDMRAPRTTPRTTAGESTRRTRTSGLQAATWIRIQ